MPTAPVVFTERKREWRGSNGVRLRLSHYRAQHEQSAHAHDHDQISFLLAGGLEERIGSTPHAVLTPAVSVKPAGTLHADRWGRSGTLILSIRAGNRTLPRGARETWLPVDAALISGALATAIAAPDGEAVDDLIDDLASCVPDMRRRGPPPPWLVRVCEAIVELGPISAVAAARIAGVHRAHLSRAFVQHLGITFGAYRRHAMTARAVEATLRTADPLAQVAVAAGFADQSHMQRAVRTALAITPRRLRTTLSPD